MHSLLDEVINCKILKKVDREYEFDSRKEMFDFVDFIFHWIYYYGATVNDNKESTMATMVDIEDGGAAEENDKEEVDAVNVGEDGDTTNTKVGKHKHR